MCAIIRNLSQLEAPFSLTILGIHSFNSTAVQNPLSTYLTLTSAIQNLSLMLHHLINDRMTLSVTVFISYRVYNNKKKTQRSLVSRLQSLSVARYLHVVCEGSLHLYLGDAVALLAPCLFCTSTARTRFLLPEIYNE